MDCGAALRAIAREDRAAFAALYTAMQHAMLRYATGILAGDRQAAEDAVDEAFFDIWRKAGNWSGVGSGEGWVRQIVRNKAIDWLRQRKGEISFAHQSDPVVARLPDTGPTASEHMEMQSEAASLQVALSQLSFEHREAVWLCYFEEKSLAEIAVLSGCPENTVKTRLFHARKKLRLVLLSTG